MAVDNIKKNGTANAYKSDAGGATLIQEPVIGIVKNNIDPTHTGMIDVYVAKLGGTDPDDSSCWVKGVKYLSPFYGITGAGTDPLSDGNKTGDGKFVGNPQSYGFWASAPDIGTEVVCIFINGLQNQAYYIGCVPKPGLLQMTPALGSSSNVVPNESEGTSYGGADRLPTSEVNYSNPSIKKSPQIYNEPKPVHSYQASILSAQGLIRDNIRGVISSSAQRETPSRVFGFSTPGGPIFEGGFTNQTIANAVKTADPSKLKQVGRTGGHSFVMDDGTLTGQDQLIRLRSSAGHQITMSDTGQTLFIIHSNGQSWIEMGKEGTIDIYSTNSFNVRTQGDINFHADRDINLNAAKNLNMFGENINIESSKNYSQRVGVNFSHYTMGKYTVKVDGAMSQQSSGQASYASSAETFINGSKVNLNSGSASTTPTIVPPIPKTSHIDTTNSPTVGWMNPSPNPLVSVTNRAPAHQPWIGSGKGVDVKIESSPPPATEQSTPATKAANDAAPPVPNTPVTPAEVLAVPTTASVASSIVPAATAGAMVAQLAATAQNNPVANVIDKASGLTTVMAESAGALKPGSSELVNNLVDKGMPQVKALVGSVTSAAGSITSPDQLIKNVDQQAKMVGETINKATEGLVSAGVINGKESITETAGAIMGAATKGVGAVTDLAKNGVSSVTGLMDDIAGGKFAAGLADGLSLSGLKDSLSGLESAIKGKVDALGDSITQLTSGLASGLQTAYASVEKSFGTLKSGVANVLGPKADGTAATKQPSDIEKATSAFQTADAELESATQALVVAKRNARNEPGEDSSNKLKTAESDLASARQKRAQAIDLVVQTSSGGEAKSIEGNLKKAGTSIVSGPLAGLANAAAATVTGAITGSSVLSTVKSLAPQSSIVGDSILKAKTTLDSGLNALPGGQASVQTLINNSPVGKAIGSASSTLNIIDDKVKELGGIGNLGGDLVANTKKLVDSKLSSFDLNSLGDFKAGAAGAMAELMGKLSSVSSGAGGILKQAVAAKNTFDNSAIIAKTGQLLGDPKIPSPTSIFSDNSLPPSDATQASSEVTAALSEVNKANAEFTAAKIGYAQAIDSNASPEVIAEKTKIFREKEAALKVAQDAYTSLVSA